MRYCILFLMSVFSFYSRDIHIPLNMLDTQLLKPNIYTVESVRFCSKNTFKSDDVIKKFKTLGNPFIQVAITFPHENFLEIEEYNLYGGKKFMTPHTFLSK